MNSSPAKGRRLIQTKIQEVDSRFSQCHQGLILADRLSMAMSIDTRDQIEILIYYRKCLTIQESSYFWKYSLWRAACNCKFSFSCLQPSDISSHSQDPYHSSYYPRGKCFLWKLFLCSEAPWNQSTMNEERWSGLGKLLIHGGMDYIPEREVIYQMKQKWRKWTSLASF